jgi:cell division protein FtsB
MAGLRRRPWGENPVRRREWLQLIAVAISIAIALTAIQVVFLFFMAG